MSSSKIDSFDPKNTYYLHRLITWLEYGKTSGYVAARCSKEQEEAWAAQLKRLMDIMVKQESVIVWARIVSDWSDCNDDVGLEVAQERVRVSIGELDEFRPRNNP